jgi:antitoxin (DNA-binding transcriptional repressor) of toxin-antitoxin stability system
MPLYTPRGKRDKEKTRKLNKRSSQNEEASVTPVVLATDDEAGPSTAAPAKNKGGRPPKRRPSAPLTPLSRRPPQEFPSTSTAEPMDIADIPFSSNDNTSESEYSNNEMCVGGEEEQPKLRRIETRKGRFFLGNIKNIKKF